MLSNMRWLTLPSEAMGEDWAQKTAQIDELILHEGVDLAEESVFLIFNRAPGSILDKVGECVIGRSVIGPKKEYKSPFKLLDWTAGEVIMEPLKSSEWESVLLECLTHWENLHRANKPIAGPFMLKLDRRIHEQKLHLSTSVIFHE